MPANRKNLFLSDLLYAGTDHASAHWAGKRGKRVFKVTDQINKDCRAIKETEKTLDGLIQQVDPIPQLAMPNQTESSTDPVLPTREKTMNVVNRRGKKPKKTKVKIAAANETNTDLTFLPGAIQYRNKQQPLRGKPLLVLRELNKAQGKTLVLSALRDKIWADSEIGEETIRSAVATARKALRKLLKAAKAKNPTDPLPIVDRGTNLTAWRLDLP